MKTPSSNPQQLLASHPEKHVWVAASAGSGKTKVLTDRVLRLLLNHTPPSQILCITYTKAAANEMQTRIHDTLARWAMLDETALTQALHAITDEQPTSSTLQYARCLFTQLLEHTPSLRIHTIHAFCQSLLARFPLEAGISPHFQILDERSRSELIAEAQTWMLQHGFHDNSTDIPTIATQALQALSLEINETSFQGLMQEIIGKQNFIEQIINQFYPKNTGAESITFDNFSPHTNPLVHALYQRLELDTSFDSEESIFQHYFNFTEQKRAAIQALIEAFSTYGGKVETSHIATLQRILQEPIPTPQTIENYLNIFLTTEGEPRSTTRFPTKKVQDNAPWIKDWIAWETSHILTYKQQLTSLQLARKTYYMLVVGHQLFTRYQYIKNNHNWLDYDDIILYTRNLLCGERMLPWVLYKLDQGISHILVDEAQDTSPLQWELVGALAQEFFSGDGAQAYTRTLFIVGDEKQSIYRFQGADVTGFARMREQFKHAAHFSAQDLHTIRLSLSYRSCPAVLEAVDAIFSHAQARQGLSYDADTTIQHQAFRANAKGIVEIWPILRAEKEQNDDFFPITKNYKDIKDVTLQLAQRIASTIATWLREARPLHSKSRPVTAGDILILVRSRTKLVNTLSRELKRLGVPVAGLDRLILTSNIAIKDLIAIGQCVLLPEDDLTLATLLRSPLYSLSEEALFELCYQRGKASVWQRLRQYTGHDTAILAAKDELNQLFATADHITPYDFYTNLLYKLNGRARLVARLGEEILDPINVFLNEAQHYEQLHAPSLQGFLHWITQGNSSVKRDLEQGIDAVRIMTVHASKGLQAPIVILPDTLSKPKPQLPPLIADAPQDGGIPFVFCMPNKTDDTPFTRTLRKAHLQAEIDEYHRQFYVALTRAEDELYICGSEGIKASPTDCWYHLAHHALSNMTEVTPVATHEAYPYWSEEETPILRLSHIPKDAISSTIPSTTTPYEAITLPAWLTSHAPHEPTPPKPLAPSKLVEQAPLSITPDIRATTSHNHSMLRGILIHRLLHILSSIPTAQQHNFAHHYLQKHARTWSETQCQQLVDEVLHVMQHPEFAPVFGKDSLAEVPLTGTIWDNTVIAGQVDRLVITDTEILIVDFKSGTAPQHNTIPAAYIKQMHAYYTLLSAIYPQHTIRCALLYTASATFIPIHKFN